MEPWLVFVLLGLFLDVIGAVFIVKSLLKLNRVPQFFSEDSTEWLGIPDANTGNIREYLAKMITEQSNDAKIGIVLLVIGFTLQGIGNVIQHADWSWQ